MTRTAGLLALLLAACLLPACDSKGDDTAGPLRGGGNGPATTAPAGTGPRPGAAQVAAARTVVDEAAKPHFDRGVVDARAAIAAGRPCVKTLGYTAHDAGGMDTETGLPEENEGCVIDDELGGWVAGWNAEIRRALAAGELEGASLRHKVTTAEAVAARFATDPGAEIRAGADPVTAPGGRYRIESAAHPTLDGEYLWVVDAAGGERRPLVYYGGAARLLFEHDGTTLLVSDVGHGGFATFDLPSGTYMQAFRGR